LSERARLEKALPLLAAGRAAVDESLRSGVSAALSEAGGADEIARGLGDLRIAASPPAEAGEDLADSRELDRIRGNLARVGTTGWGASDLVRREAEVTARVAARREERDLPIRRKASQLVEWAGEGDPVPLIEALRGAGDARAARLSEALDAAARAIPDGAVPALIAAFEIDHAEFLREREQEERRKARH
jgi:hypothetical protein